MSLFQTYDEVFATEGAHAAPADRIGKLRCRNCLEWIPAHNIDRALHARQERIGMRYCRADFHEHHLPDQPWRQVYGNE